MITLPLLIPPYFDSTPPPLFFLALIALVVLELQLQGYLKKLRKQIDQDRDMRHEIIVQSGEVVATVSDADLAKIRHSIFSSNEFYFEKAKNFLEVEIKYLVVYAFCFLICTAVIWISLGVLDIRLFHAVFSMYDNPTEDALNRAHSLTLLLHGIVLFGYFVYGMRNGPKSLGLVSTNQNWLSAAIKKHCGLKTEELVKVKEKLLQ